MSDGAQNRFRNPVRDPFPALQAFSKCSHLQLLAALFNSPRLDLEPDPRFSNRQLQAHPKSIVKSAVYQKFLVDRALFDKALALIEPSGGFIIRPDTQIDLFNDIGIFRPTHKRIDHQCADAASPVSSLHRQTEFTAVPDSGELSSREVQNVADVVVYQPEDKQLVFRFPTLFQEFFSCCSLKANSPGPNLRKSVSPQIRCTYSRTDRASSPVASRITNSRPFRNGCVDCSIFDTLVKKPQTSSAIARSLRRGTSTPSS